MPAKPRNRRSRELAKIHMGAKALGLDTQDKDPDSPYRSMLWAVARQRSAKDLDAAGRTAVLAHMKSLGVKQPPWRPRPSYDREALLGKIRAQLHAAGREEAYADGMAKKMFAVERVIWCNSQQLSKIVAALSYDAKRHGRERP